MRSSAKSGDSDAQAQPNGNCSLARSSTSQPMYCAAASSQLPPTGLPISQAQQQQGDCSAASIADGLRTLHERIPPLPSGLYRQARTPLPAPTLLTAVITDALK